MEATRLIRSHTMHLHARPHRVFPLLCPVREYEWIEPWACNVVHSRSGVAELDCVFQTNFPDDGPQDTWVVSRHEPPSRIEFVRVNGLRSMRYSIVLEPEGDVDTRAVWTQVITALGEAGARWLEQGNDALFTAKMTVLERRLNHFLTTGQCLSLPPG